MKLSIRFMSTLTILAALLFESLDCFLLPNVSGPDIQTGSIFVKPNDSSLQNRSFYAKSKNYTFEVNFSKNFTTTPTVGIWIMKIFPSISNTSISNISTSHCMSVFGNRTNTSGFTIIF
jgi:hypothetical protein